MAHDYDALLVVSFGAPEGREEVLPFLENVLRGKNVPPERMMEVAGHYEHFGGVSPLNAQVRALMESLETELADHGIRLPMYWGNRNWHPLLADTLRAMAGDGVRRALAFVTSAYSSYSGCRQYLEDIERARAQVGDRAPQVDKLRAFYNHPGFIESQVEKVREAIDRVPADRRSDVRLVYTAHSIPMAMARGCRYAAQLEEAARLVSARVGPYPWKVVYQSRSGPPGQAWLEPDVCSYLRQLHEQGTAGHVVLVPIGFTSDHLEVVYDLDVEAAGLGRDLGLPMVRAETVGTQGRFVRMIRELIVERMKGLADRPVVGPSQPCPDVCPADCCPRVVHVEPGGLPAT
jgi:ferrochelatase